LLAAQALTGYFGGTLRVGPRVLTAVSAVPIVVHLALAWLLVGLLSWSVAGAGLARLGAALAAAAATLAVARPELSGFVVALRRPDRALLRSLLAEGSMLGLQQVVASLMVLLLYLMASRAGDVTSAALTLTHSGIYPLLFAFAWGGSQAVGAVAARAVGRSDAGELARGTRLCLGLSAVLAFALPWGLFAACGGPTLAWLAGGGPTGGAVLATSSRFMVLLAVFFVFDFAINFLSALLKAAKEQAYLLKATSAAAVGFGLLVLALPPRPGALCLMGAFIAVQAAWAVSLLIRVAHRWPGAAPESGPASRAPRRPEPMILDPLARTVALVPSLWGGKKWDGEAPGSPKVGRKQPLDRLPGRADWPGRPVYRRSPTLEEPAMDPFQLDSAPPPQALRALALSLLIEAVIPVLNRSGEESLVLPGRGAGGAAGEGELWQALRSKCSELSALVLRANDPGEAAAYVLRYLPGHFNYVFEQVFGQKRLPSLGCFEGGHPVALRHGGPEAGPA
jgi:hypothetical protein